jgi:hypothetical protein
VGKILENELVAQASPPRGRFRTFLLNALDNFDNSQWQRIGWTYNSSQDARIREGE